MCGRALDSQIGGVSQLPLHSLASQPTPSGLTWMCRTRAQTRKVSFNFFILPFMACWQPHCDCDVQSCACNTAAD